MGIEGSLYRRYQDSPYIYYPKNCSTIRPSKNPYFTEGGIRKMNIVRVFTIFKFCIPPAENIGLFECPTINTNKNI